MNNHNEQAAMNAKTRRPKISIIFINKNHGKYIDDALQSIALQKYSDYEVVVADGGSTDDSLEIISRYPFTRVISEPDSSAPEGLFKALQSSCGEYVMFMTSTDGYLSRNWFSRVAQVLDKDKDVSLVWGNSQYMDESGSLGAIAFFDNFQKRPPQKHAWSILWLNDDGLSTSYLPELNYCVRADIAKKLHDLSEEYPELNSIDSLFRFHFEFHRLGYLTRYLPISANFGRTHANQRQNAAVNQHGLDMYQAAKRRYMKRLLSGEVTYYIRDGNGKIIGQLNIEKGA